MAVGISSGGCCAAITDLRSTSVVAARIVPSTFWRGNGAVVAAGSAFDAEAIDSETLPAFSTTKKVGRRVFGARFGGLWSAARSGRRLVCGV